MWLSMFLTLHFDWLGIAPLRTIERVILPLDSKARI